MWPPVVVLAAILLCWQAAVDFGMVQEWVLPSPLAIVQESVKVWPRLMEHTGATLRLTLLGFAGGAAAGFVLAALLHLIPGVRRGIYPLLVLTQNVPVIAIAPILTMLLGYGFLPKLLLLMIVCFFPITIALLGGLTHTDPQLRHYFQMLGIGKWRMFWHVELPGAVAPLFSGLKISASYSVLSAIVAEWLGTNKGLGAFMLISFKGFQPARGFAAVLIVVAFSLLMFGAVTVAERFWLRWKPAKEGDVK